MKSLTDIQVDFNQAIRQAEELEEAAGEMRQTANRDFDELLRDISASWEGDSATEYVRKGRLLKEKIIKNAKDLDRVASVIRSNAKRYYDAEMRNYRIAKQRVR